jgi:hypothetical protein
MAPTRGQLFELRVARLLHAEGAFVRRRVNLDQFVGEKVQVTDIDVLAFFFDRTLSLRLVAAECKTAEGRSAPSTKDRLLWLHGVNSLVGAQEGFLATSRAARDPERRFASLIGLAVLDPRDLERRETILGLKPDSGIATHSEQAVALEDEIAKVVQKDDEMKRVYAFLRSEAWLVAPVAALKRALGAARILGGRYADSLPAGERQALEWLAAEVVVATTVALTRLAGESYRAPEEVFARHLAERLAEGLASYSAMREISQQVDKFVMGVLREAGVDPTRVVGALGALTPRPPGYTEPLLELVQRLAAVPAATAELARSAEDAYGRRLLGEGETPSGEIGRLLRLVATFLEHQAHLPATLLAPLRERTEPAAPDGESGTRGVTASTRAPEKVDEQPDPAQTMKQPSDERERGRSGESGGETGNDSAPSSHEPRAQTLFESGR